jgi:hypothetical protein
VRKAGEPAGSLKPIDILSTVAVLGVVFLIGVAASHFALA